MNRSFINKRTALIAAAVVFSLAVVAGLILSATLSLSPAAFDTSAPRSVLNDGTRIVFPLELSQNGSVPSMIYSAAPDGTDVRQVTFGCDFGSTETNCEDFTPAVSPDGKRVAFTRLYDNYEDEREGLYVINMDGTGMRFLTSLGYQPDWSPDGSQLVFSKRSKSTRFNYGSGDSNLSIINADGTDERLVTYEVSAYHPSWSPDGQKIVFSNGIGLSTINVDGTELQTLVVDPNRSDPSTPVWSPDGTRVAFYASEDGLFYSRSAIYTVNADGTDRQRLGRGIYPTWSPEGKHILFSEEYNEGRSRPQLFYMDAESGGEVARVTSASLVTEGDVGYFADGDMLHEARATRTGAFGWDWYRP